jgi:N utilization substance protein B
MSQPKNATRRQAREWAVQILFQLDANPSKDIDATLESFWIQQWHSKADETKDATGEKLNLPETPAAIADAIAPHDTRAFVEHLIKGTLEHRAQIDEKIPLYVHNWTVNRLGAIERTVLRLALFEIFFSDRTPPVVVLNEAIDLVKYFGNNESGRFINGILDRAIKDAPRKKG